MILLDSKARQDAEERELLEMENEKKMDQEELDRAEREFMDEEEDLGTSSDEKVDDDEDDDEKVVNHYIDSPYPSDDEDSDNDEFTVTDRLMDDSIRSDNESLIPVNDLVEKLEKLRTVDSTSPTPLLTSSPTYNGSTSITGGQILVTDECISHCECITCSKCTVCGVCENCLVCFKCVSGCNFKQELLVTTSRRPRKTKAEYLKSLKTKCVGDNLNGGDTVDDIDGDTSVTIDEVSELLGYDCKNAIATKRPKETKTYNFCKRRILINNRRLDIQETFRTGGLVDQNGTIRFLYDSEFFMIISLVGFTDMMVPRYGVDLLCDIKFCPYIRWTVIKLDGASNWTIDNLKLIGEFLKDHLKSNNRVSVQPIRPIKAQKPVRRTSDQPMGGTPAQLPKMDEEKKTKKKLVTNKKRDTKAVPSSSQQPVLQPPPPPPLIVPPVVPPPVAPPVQQFAQRILVGFPDLPPPIVQLPIFEWKMEDRNLGSPGDRRRRHMAQKESLPNQVVMNGVKRLVHNGRPADRVNEEREMKFITT